VAVSIGEGCFVFVALLYIGNPSGRSPAHLQSSSASLGK
jgi:hypothetical protein